MEMVSIVVKGCGLFKNGGQVVNVMINGGGHGCKRDRRKKFKYSGIDNR